MDRVIVRPAVPEDWPQIRAIRDAYYAGRSQPVQDREGQGDWQVAEAEGHIVAIVSHQEVPALRQRWQMDFYGDGTALGKAGLSAIIRAVYEKADRDNVTLCGITELDNTENLQAALNRGWQVGGIMIFRPPKTEGQ